MLTINTQQMEYYDERKSEFITIPECTLELEHSLVSISEWESKWKKSFLSSDDKTNEEIADYIRIMITDKSKRYMAQYLSPSILTDIFNYMSDTMTATVINRRNNSHGHSRDIITSELIYYWMISLNIPFECQYWHINRLLTLIDVVSLKQQPAKKMNTKNAMEQQRSLNAQRRAASKSKG